MLVNPQNVYRDDYRKIVSFFRMVRASSNVRLDGRVLEMAFRLVFYCGLKKKELIRIKISKTVNNQYSMYRLPVSMYEINAKFSQDRGVKRINGLTRDIEIPEKARDKLKIYFKYLKNHAIYKCSRNYPLFPKTDGDWSTIENLDYHMRQYSGMAYKSTGSTFKEFSYEYLRQSGIRFYYLKLIKLNHSPQSAFNQTVQFAGNNKYHVRDILLNQIKK